MRLPAEVVELPGNPVAHLRAFTPDDWPLERALSLVDDVPRWTYYTAGMSEEEARTRATRSTDSRAEGRAARYVVVVEGEPAGTAGISALHTTRPEIFYALLPGARGRGLATRAAGALTAWALAAGYGSVALYTRPGNSASESVAARAGFVLDGEERGPGGELLRAWVRRATLSPR